MLSDFKISRITENENGIKVIARFYEGEKTSQLEKTGKEELMMERYRRSVKHAEREFSFPTKTSLKEISLHLKKELAKDETRTPIDEQKLA